MLLTLPVALFMFDLKTFSALYSIPTHKATPFSLSNSSSQYLVYICADAMRINRAKAEVYFNLLRCGIRELKKSRRRRRVHRRLIKGLFEATTILHDEVHASVFISRNLFWLCCKNKFLSSIPCLNLLKSRFNHCPNSPIQ